MADELKTTTTSTFAQDEPEPSESDIIRARVNNYKVSLTPQAAQANITILEKSLRQGIFGLGDLDGDGEVNVLDLLILIAAWGACP